VTETVACNFYKHLTWAGDGYRRLGEFRGMFPLDDTEGLHLFGHGLILSRVVEMLPDAAASHSDRPR
jgi:hypothetical protein